MTGDAQTEAIASYRRRIDQVGPDSRGRPQSDIAWAQALLHRARSAELYDPPPPPPVRWRGRTL